MLRATGFLITVCYFMMDNHYILGRRIQKVSMRNTWMLKMSPTWLNSTWMSAGKGLNAGVERCVEKGGRSVFLVENGSQHDHGGGGNNLGTTVDSTCSIKHNRCHYFNPNPAFNVVSDTFFHFLVWFSVSELVFMLAVLFLTMRGDQARSAQIKKNIVLTLSFIITDSSSFDSFF